MQEWLDLATPKPKSVVKNVTPPLPATVSPALTAPSLDEKFPSGWKYDSEFLASLDRDEMISILNDLADQETGIWDLYVFVI
jgi:hypothetical protein